MNQNFDFSDENEAKEKAKQYLIEKLNSRMNLNRDIFSELIITQNKEQTNLNRDITFAIKNQVCKLAFFKKYFKS